MVQLGKKTAAAICGCGSVNFVICIIAGVLIGNTFKTAMNNLMVYKYDENFKDPMYEDCTPSSDTFYFWNMTNFEDVIKKQAKPMYAEKGPYTYTRDKCKFNASVEGNMESAYFYEPYGVYQPGNPSLSEHDVIYNFNFIYLSVMKMMEGMGPSPEYTFSINFVGHLMMEVIKGMQTPDFINSIEGGFFSGSVLPSVVSTLQGVVLENARAVNAISFVSANTTGAPAVARDFFNNQTKTGGYAAYVGTAQTISDPSIELILRGDGVGANPLGWLVQTQYGKGLVDFIHLTTDATNAAKYQVTLAQFTKLQEYAKLYLVETLGQSYNNVNVNDMAKQFLYTQWASKAITPSGLTQVPGFELSTSLVLPTATLIKLWNTTDSMSFANTQGPAAWMASINSTSINGNLATHFGITTAQVTTIANWVNGMVVANAPTLLGALGISSAQDLAYVQFGQGSLLNGMSLSQVSSAVTGIPEIAIFSNYTLTFNVSTAKAIVAKSQDPANVGGLMGMVAAGAFSTVESQWGLNMSQAIMMAQYYDAVVTTMVEPFLIHSVYSHGSGLIVGRSVREWLYNGSDPMMGLIGLPTKSGIKVQSSQLTRAEALAKGMKQTEIFLGGGREKLEQYLLKKTYKGSVTVTGWAQNITVTGNRDPIFLPGIKHGEEQLYWVDDLLRPVTFVDMENEVMVKGVKTYQYRTAPSFYGSAAAFPQNAIYYQNVEGILNLTAISPLRTYMSRPHYRGVPTSFYDGLVQTPFNPDESKYDAFDLYLQPDAGVPFKAETLLQYNFGYKDLGRYYNLSSGTGIYPFFWNNMTMTVEDDMAQTFIKGKKTVTLLSTLAFASGPIMFALSVVAAIVIYVRAHRRGRVTYVRSLE